MSTRDEDDEFGPGVRGELNRLSNVRYSSTDPCPEQWEAIQEATRLTKKALWNVLDGEDEVGTVRRGVSMIEGIASKYATMDCEKAHGGMTIEERSDIRHDLVPKIEDAIDNQAWWEAEDALVEIENIVDIDWGTSDDDRDVFEEAENAVLRATGARGDKPRARALADLSDALAEIASRGVDPEDMREELNDLKQQIGELNEEFFDFDPTQVLSMAENAELDWDAQSFQGAAQNFHSAAEALRGDAEFREPRGSSQAEVDEATPEPGEISSTTREKGSYRVRCVQGDSLNEVEMELNSALGEGEPESVNIDQEDGSQMWYGCVLLKKLAREEE